MKLYSFADLTSPSSRKWSLSTRVHVSFNLAGIYCFLLHLKKHYRPSEKEQDKTGGKEDFKKTITHKSLGPNPYFLTITVMEDTESAVTRPLLIDINSDWLQSECELLQTLII